MKRLVVIVLTLLPLTLAHAQQQQWQYGALIITDSMFDLYAPQRDEFGYSLNNLANKLAREAGVQIGEVETGSALVLIFNVLGREGWELIGVDGPGTFVFKRPLHTPP